MSKINKRRSKITIRKKEDNVENLLERKGKYGNKKRNLQSEMASYSQKNYVKTMTQKISLLWKKRLHKLKFRRPAKIRKVSDKCGFQTPSQ